jgi:hypothetical protein
MPDTSRNTHRPFIIRPDMLTRTMRNYATDVLTAKLLFVFLGPVRSLPSAFPQLEVNATCYFGVQARSFCEGKHPHLDFKV